MKARKIDGICLRPNNLMSENHLAVVPVFVEVVSWVKRLAANCGRLNCVKKTALWLVLPKNF
jgi:hypothetical protein